MEVWTLENAVERNGDLVGAGDPRALYVAGGRLRGGEGLPGESRRAWLIATIARIRAELRLVRASREEDLFAVKWAQDVHRRARSARVAELLAEKQTLEKCLRRLLGRRP